jgi:hypothetical protein
MELTDRSSMLNFSPVTQVAVLNIDADVAGHLGPPVVVGYELEGLEAACMSSDALSWCCSTIRCLRSLSLGT